MIQKTHKPARIWPTLGLVITTTLVWGLTVYLLADVSVVLAVLALAPVIALHSSLQHEVIHGHPFANPKLNALLVAPAFSLTIPFLRYRDLHLAHHMDARLTDPYDDPESAYLDPAVYDRLPRAVQGVLMFNNTLLGRMVIGPLVGQVVFIWQEVRGANRDVIRGWAWHLPAVAVVLAALWMSPMPIWAYGIAAYLGQSILKIRTFAEHQAHTHTAARSVVVEGRGILSFLFLNNNLHAVHHMHPSVPWYQLPQLYAANRDRYLRRNQGYLYRSYGTLIARYFWRRKEPVAHPLWSKGQRGSM